MSDKKVFKPLLVTLIIVLALFAGVVIWDKKQNKNLFLKTERESSEFKGYQGIPGFKTEENKTGKIEITETLAEKLVNNTLSTEYEDKTIRTYVADLNNDSQDEFIISGFKKKRSGQMETEGLLMVVTPTDGLGQRKKIGELVFPAIYSREIESMGSDNKVLDIEADGIKELVLDLGANQLGYNEFYGIFKIDFNTNKIEWLQLDDEYGVRRTEFSQGNANTGATAFEIKDVDADGFLDVEETIYPPAGEPTGDKTINIYYWNGEMFVL